MSDPRDEVAGRHDRWRDAERREAERRDEEPKAPAGGVYDWYQRGLHLLSTGHPAAAVQLLSHAVSAEPTSRSIREALARAQFGARMYDDARRNFSRIVADNPADDYAQFGVGLASARTGALDDAVHHLAIATAMRPDNNDYASALRSVRATLRARRSA